MKITLVCGHFIPALGYIEVHLARAFAQLGHRVSVITSSAIPGYVGKLSKGFGTDPKGVEVIRLKPKFTLGQIVIANGIKKELNRINPDLVIVIGLGKAFPKPVFDIDFPVISLLGDNAYSYASGSLKTRLLFSLFKEKTYRAAIDKSKQLVAYTPESFEAAAKMIGPGRASILRKQTHFVSLGFWSDEFYFDPELRNAKRNELDFRESDTIIITATRLVPEKKLEEAIPLFEKLPDNVKWLLVGSAGDAYAKELESKLAQNLRDDRFKMLGYADRAELNALYNAADIALYTVPAISIFEAIGTGLPVILPGDKSLERIVKGGYSIARYRGDETKIDPKDLSEIKNVDNRKNRSSRAESQFSWVRVAEQILMF